MTYEEMWHRLSVVYGQGEAKALSRMLLEEKFGLSLADIICGGVDQLSASDTRWLVEALARMEGCEPIQYVLGESWFCGNRFAVGEGVLIPRPETEWLVNRAAAIAGGSGAGLRLLDIGTGSGCIAVSLKLLLPEAYVEAWDISAEALDIARANARRLSADVEFSQCDALSIAADSRRWDVIVSNPPYICDSERADMAANVLDHEPSSALFVPDDNPLLFYRAIAGYASASLVGGGSLLFECNTRYAAATADMLRSSGFAAASVADDCFGKPRFVEASTFI